MQPQHLAQYLALNRCSINICGITEVDDNDFCHTARGIWGLSFCNSKILAAEDGAFGEKRWEIEDKRWGNCKTQFEELTRGILKN